MRYRKKKIIPDEDDSLLKSGVRKIQVKPEHDWVIGMLYIVEIRMVNRRTREKIKQKILVVGCEAQDIDRKIRWMIDLSKYDEFSISSVEKVKEKIHVISTIITQDKPLVNPVVKSEDGSKIVIQASAVMGNDEPHLYAIGIVTTMIGADENHVLRKLGHALVNTGGDFKSRSGASLSDNSTITIEEIPFKDGIAKPRDTSLEVNQAKFVSGGSTSPK